MKSWKGLVLLVCLWAVGGYVWWAFYRDPANRAPWATSNTRETVMAPPPPGMESWPFKTEQHWMADEIGRDIAEMIRFAKDPVTPVANLSFSTTAPSLSEGKFEFSAKAAGVEAKQSGTLTHHFWAGENYAPWAKLLLEKWSAKVPAQSTAPNTTLVSALTSPAQGLLVVEGQRVTRELSQHPLDAELHEEAALLQGFLAMREAAGQFYDARHALCRMSAHLALARALQEKPAVCGQLAEVIQLALVGREVETLEKAEQLPSELQPWVRALKLRANFDWRSLDHPEKATLLEQMEYGRALVHCDLTAKLQDFLQKVSASQMPDWGRMVTEENFSVEQGHIFAKDSLGLELQELAEDWKSWCGKELKADTLVVVANDTPGRCVANAGDGKQAMEVLGWGDLAAFHQRHICHSIQRTEDFLRNKWGVPEEAGKFEQFVNANLSGLRLAPIVLKRCAQNSTSYAPAMRDSLALCNKTPQLVTAANWACLAEPVPYGTQSRSIPRPQAWFSPDLPFGTTYDFGPRYYELHHLWAADTATWDKILETAPYHHDVIRAHRHKKLGPNVSLAQVEESQAKICDYDLKSAWEIARHAEKEPAKYMAAMKKVAVMDGDSYIDLGDFQVEQHHEGEAAEAYRAAFEKAHDRVRMANCCDWIVNYDFDHGRKDEALKIATDAAEVYSYRGLETMAHLMERMEKWEAAEKYYGNIAERYSDQGPLASFYMRHQEKNPKMAAALKRITDEVYPDGVEKATLASFNGAPKDGAVIMSTNTHTTRAHLKKGDVIVALDGYRVHSMEQYTWVRALAHHDVPLNLIVWNGSKYTDVKANPPKRRFECDMITYLGR